MNSSVAPGLRFDADPARLTLVFDKTGVVLPDLHVRGDFVLDANGTVTQVIGSNLKVDGTASFSAQTSDITINQPGNDFVGKVSLKGGSDVYLSDINALALASDIEAYRLHVESHGDLNLGSGVVYSDLVAKSNGGLIHQDGVLTLSNVQGYGHQIDAGSGDVLLDQANNLITGAIAVRGAAVTLVNGRTLGLFDLQLATLGNTVVRTDADLSVFGTVGSASQAGNLSLTSKGRTTLGAVKPSGTVGTTVTLGTTVWGNLSVNARLGVTQNGPLTVSGHSDVVAQGQDIDLSNPANDFVGLLALDTRGTLANGDEVRGNASVTSVGALRLDQLSVASLDLIANSRTETTAAGRGELNLGHGSLTGRLNAASRGGNIVQASGGLDIRAGATLNTAIADSGLADAADITLLDVANRFTGKVSLRGRTVKIYDDIDLMLGSVLIDNLEVDVRSGILTLGGGTINGTLTATNRGEPAVRPEGSPASSRVTGVIGQSAPLSILDPMGVSVFSVPDTRNIALNDPGNEFRGLVEMHSLISPRP